MTFASFLGKVTRSVLAALPKTARAQVDERV
jgi:hypothetical protein